MIIRVWARYELGVTGAQVVGKVITYSQVKYSSFHSAVLHRVVRLIINSHIHRVIVGLLSAIVSGKAEVGTLEWQAFYSGLAEHLWLRQPGINVWTCYEARSRRISSTPGFGPLAIGKRAALWC